PEAFFFSSRRRHTRSKRDWSFRRVLFRSLPRAIRKPVEHTASSRREETVSRISSHRTSGMWRWAAGISVTVSRARPALFQLDSRDRKSVVEGKREEPGARSGGETRGAAER